MRISVIMASYLENYRGGSTNRPAKFLRAVKSFQNQSYENKELIIVSDGCEITNQLYGQHFKDIDNIKLVSIPKQPIFAGSVRNAGIDVATGDIIAYLDSDDAFGKEHLKIIAEQFTDDVDMVYYNDYLVKNKEMNKFEMRYVLPRWASIGTSSIAHKNSKSFKGVFCDGYGHDFLTVVKAVTNGASFKKLERTPQYLVCHTSNTDF